MKIKNILLLVGVGLSLAGCSSKPANLASQIGPVTTIIEPLNSPTGRVMQQVRFKFRNNGPVEIGEVSGNLEAFYANGNKTHDSYETDSIFIALKPDERLKSGQEYQDPPNEGQMLYGYSGPIVRVVFTVTEARQAYDPDAK